MKECEVSAILSQLGLLIARADAKGKSLDISKLVCLGSVLIVKLYPHKVDAALSDEEPTFMIMLDLDDDLFYAKACRAIDDVKAEIG